MKTAIAVPMIDIQNEADHRKIAIDQVGISDLKHPVVVLDRQNQRQNTTGMLTMSVNLPHHFKGTHMSRFIEVLTEHQGEFTMHTLPVILADLKRRLHAESAQISVRFPYFLERTAPVTGAKALMDYECWFEADANCHHADFLLGVAVPVTSLCPCSKAISDYGAHNQRGMVSIELRTRSNTDGKPELMWIEEVVEIAEASGSAPVYPLLKRPDERYVTMQAYDNPVFVEDLVRNVSVRLQQDERVNWFRVRVVNQESIHNHNAYALIEWSRD